MYLVASLLFSLGQSFGAFLSPGVTLELEGDSNDYVGKVTSVYTNLIVLNCFLRKIPYCLWSGTRFSFWTRWVVTCVLHETRPQLFNLQGLAGGKIIVYPSNKHPENYKAEENIIVGNVCFYGSTAGKVRVSFTSKWRYFQRANFFIYCLVYKGSGTEREINSLRVKCFRPLWEALLQNGSVSGIPESQQLSRLVRFSLFLG